MTPTNRSVKYLEACGATVGLVERKLTRFISKDFFGFADLIYVLGPNTVAVQVTTGANHAARKDKILKEPRAIVWLKAEGNLIELHSWRKNSEGHWILRNEEIVEADFAPQEEHHETADA